MGEVDKILLEAEKILTHQESAARSALISIDAFCQLVKRAAEHDCAVAVGSVINDDVWKKVHRALLSSAVDKDVSRLFTFVSINFDWNDNSFYCSYESETRAFIDALHERLQQANFIP